MSFANRVQEGGKWYTHPHERISRERLRLWVRPACCRPRAEGAVSRRGGMLLALAIASSVFVVDRGVKVLVEGSMRLGESIPLIPGFLSLTYIKNDGGAFGILGGSRLVLLIGSAVAIGVVFWILLSGRSEEHTSELQSRQYLVCRLLLEKKTKSQLIIKTST